MKLVGYYRGMEVYEDESCPPDTIYFVSKGFEMANAWLTPELMKEFGIEEADMCGPPEWTTGKNDPFLFMCLKHDRDFLGIKTWGDYVKANEAFKKFMFNWIRMTKPWYEYPYWFVRALLYYNAAAWKGREILRRRGVFI